MSQLELFSAAQSAAPSLKIEPRRRWETRREVQTRAGVISCYADDPDPIEIVVRGIPTVIAFGMGFGTHAIQPPGSLYWSETGYRSFCCSLEAVTHDPQEIAALVESYIDAPAKDGGCGGRLKRWWPGYALQWRQNLAFELSAGRATTWTQWGPEKHAELWEGHDRRQRADLERMRIDGIDPAAVGPPDGFRGRWPRLAQAALL